MNNIDKEINDVIEWYYANKKVNEDISIDELREVLSDKYNISKLKALNLLKQVAQTRWCSSSSNTPDLIFFVGQKGVALKKKYLFNMGVMQVYFSHVRICKRNSREYWDNLNSRNR
jgi:hypothetical protein